MIRPDEAAAMLGIGRSKVYAMLAAGELPCVKVGRSSRVPIDGLREWVAEQSGNRNKNETKGGAD